MLNKDICKKCMVERYGTYGGEWESEDDIVWDKGYVICRINLICDVNSSVNKNCHKYFEQLILGPK